MKTAIIVPVIWICCTVAAVAFKEQSIIFLAIAGTIAYFIFADD